MWNTQTAWFDVAVVMTIFAIGNILFGHFEEHKPKLRRVLKVMVIVGLIAALSSAGLRWIAYTLIAILALASVYVHGWWLPKHGVNGWTGEPRDRYYELLKIPPQRRRA
jgi:hypothetical protein